MRMKEVVVIGSANMDKVYRVAHIPVGGESIVASSQMYNPGGKGANQAVAAARQGADVSIVCGLGQDDDGDALVKSLVDMGVKADGISRFADAQTGIAMIVVADDGENMIVVSQGANSRVSEAVLSDHDALLRRVGIGILQMEIPHETVWAALSRLKAYGAMTILNPSPAAAIPDEALRNVDILVPNEMEMAYLLGGAPDLSSGALADYARAKGIGAIVMTLGPRGAALITAEGIRTFPCVPVKAVDSTGAGDCFLGTMAAWLAEDDPLEEAIRKAMKAAAIAVTREGAQQAMPSREEVLEG